MFIQDNRDRGSRAAVRGCVKETYKVAKHGNTQVLLLLSKSTGY